VAAPLGLSLFFSNWRW